MLFTFVLILFTLTPDFSACLSRNPRSSSSSSYDFCHPSLCKYKGECRLYGNKIKCANSKSGANPWSSIVTPQGPKRPAGTTYDICNPSLCKYKGECQLHGNKIKCAPLSNKSGATPWSSSVTPQGPKRPAGTTYDLCNPSLCKNKGECRLHGNKIECASVSTSTKSGATPWGSSGSTVTARGPKKPAGSTYKSSSASPRRPTGSRATPRGPKRPTVTASGPTLPRVTPSSPKGASVTIVGHKKSTMTANGSTIPWVTPRGTNGASLTTEGHITPTMTAYGPNEPGFKYDRCKPNPCKNGGTCRTDATQAQYGGFECVCSTIYRGNFCEKTLLRCSHLPCKRAKDCHSTLDGDLCICVGYGGTPTCIKGNAAATKWEKVKKIVSEDIVKTLGIVLGVMALITIILVVRCCNRRNKAKYKAIDAGYMPESPHPDWMDVRCAEESNFPDSYHPENKPVRRRSSIKNNWERRDSNERQQLLNSKTNMRSSRKQLCRSASNQSKNAATNVISSRTRLSQHNLDQKTSRMPYSGTSPSSMFRLAKQNVRMCSQSFSQFRPVATSSKRSLARVSKPSLAERQDNPGTGDKHSRQSVRLNEYSERPYSRKSISKYQHKEYPPMNMIAPPTLPSQPTVPPTLPFLLKQERLQPRTRIPSQEIDELIKQRRESYDEGEDSGESDSDEDDIEQDEGEVHKLVNDHGQRYVYMKSPIFSTNALTKKQHGRIKTFGKANLTAKQLKLSKDVSDFKKKLCHFRESKVKNYSRNFFEAVSTGDEYINRRSLIQASRKPAGDELFNRRPLIQASRKPVVGKLFNRRTLIQASKKPVGISRLQYLSDHNRNVNMNAEIEKSKNGVDTYWNQYVNSLLTNNTNVNENSLSQYDAEEWDRNGTPESPCTSAYPRTKAYLDQQDSKPDYGDTEISTEGNKELNANEDILKGDYSVWSMQVNVKQPGENINVSACHNRLGQVLGQTCEQNELKSIWTTTVTVSARDEAEMDSLEPISNEMAETALRNSRKRSIDDSKNLLIADISTNSNQSAEHFLKCSQSDGQTFNAVEKRTEDRDESTH